MLKHGRIGPTRPENFPKKFFVYGKESTTSERGRVIPRQLSEPKAELRCILSIAKPEVIERFNQTGVTVTHTIIQRGDAVAEKNDIFSLIKGGVEKRWFRVRAVHNKGEMDIDTTYYCEERGDLK